MSLDALRKIIILTVTILPIWGKARIVLADVYNNTGFLFFFGNAWHGRPTADLVIRAMTRITTPPKSEFGLAHTASSQIANCRLTLC